MVAFSFIYSFIYRYTVHPQTADRAAKTSGSRLILYRSSKTFSVLFKVERASQELLFKDADHFVKVGTILDEANRKAGGDLEEFGRLLQVEAALFTLGDDLDDSE